MKQYFIFTIIFSLNLYCSAQDMNVTFTATGEATSIDSVTALNQSTQQSVTLPGDEILVLKHSSGIYNIPDLENQISVYPNPFNGDSKVIVTINEPQKVNIRIQTITGQVITQSDAYLQSGTSEFEISVSDNGFYLFVVETEQGYSSCKLVSLSSSGQGDNIHYAGAKDGLQKQIDSGGKKSEQSGYSLDFTDGDNMHYTCYSGVMTTIFTDSPESSKNYDVEFAQCTDPDGMNYDVVIIGDQIWMEDNLAYLPEVDKPEEAYYSDSPHYFVYGYEGDSVLEAKSTENFNTYGVLYNWKAAMVSCPDGWHLPSDDEWTNLTNYLIMNGYGYGDDRMAIAKSIASTSYWKSSTYIGSAGNNPSNNNKSGINALPGGFIYHSGIYFEKGIMCRFWTSKEIVPNGAWRFGFGNTASHCGLGHYEQASGFSIRCLKND